MDLSGKNHGRSQMGGGFGGGFGGGGVDAA